MTPEQAAEEAWVFWKAFRNPGWTEEKNIKALVTGAVMSHLGRIEELEKEIGRWKAIVPMFERVVAAHPCQVLHCSCRELRKKFDEALKGQEE